MFKLLTGAILALTTLGACASMPSATPGVGSWHEATDFNGYRLVMEEPDRLAHMYVSVSKADLRPWIAVIRVCDVGEEVDPRTSGVRREVFNFELGDINPHKINCEGEMVEFRDKDIMAALNAMPDPPHAIRSTVLLLLGELRAYANFG